MTVRYVFDRPPGQTEVVPAGRLELVSRDDQRLTSRFQYGQRYRERADALDVDPVSLPLVVETDVAREPINGLPLFGAIRDAAHQPAQAIARRQKSPRSSAPVERQYQQSSL